AYSTISQIGFIFLGLSVGGWMGAVGGLLYILMHGLAKGGLFLCAGIIEQNAKTKDITKMGGLIQTMPFTALSFLFCAFSVMGIPPFGGFFSKYLVIAGAVWGGQKLLALTFILGAFLTILYLFRLFNLIFLGERKGEAAREGSNLMVFCVALLAGLSLLGGLLVNFPLDYLLHLSGQSTYLGIEALFRLDHFSGLMVGAILGFSALIFLYSLSFMRGKPAAGQFYLYFLLTAIFACGAVLSDNLILFLFFWEGLLLTLFGLIYIGGKNSFKTAIKAFIIVGISDLCLMLGIAWVGQLAGTFEMSKISLSLAGGGAFAFILMMIGALAKGGSMPFHTWIPDAALDAPLPFMALVPGALEKLLGIYLLARLCLEMFRLDPSSWLSPLLMTIGGLTIILAVLMALIQKDFKRLLSYHAISQVGYMVLGIGTALPIGIIGGLFHMVNNALYKSCLFLTGGAVEKQAGTTDLSKLGGLMRQMPITFICFFIAALSISGVPPFNGFFSKELIYDAALERGWIFYLFAVGGSFFTAASFLKLGHAAFLGKSEVKAKEAPWPMLLPMLALAFICVFFGVYNALPIDQLTKSVFSASVHTEPNFWLIGITILVLIGAVLNHIYGVRKTGKGIGAVDHIHYAPGMHGLFKQPDPYDIGMKFAGWVSLILYRLDRLVDWVYEVFTVNLTRAFTRGLKWMHSGNYSNYVVWSLVGAALVVLMVVR
ncbi:MAG: proton-conducting transporter membrane subunit, partial [Candidatus Margulisiibacteriota bacterium]